MKTHRIIPCLDVRDGKLTKGIQFQGNVDIGDPVLSAIQYEKDGADELIFYDITASVEQRGIFLDVAESVAKAITIPYCVGGGIATLADIQAVMDVGAKKVSINSAAVKNPDIITQGAKTFGTQAIIAAMDVKSVPPSAKTPSGFDIALSGGKTLMQIDAIAWAKRCEELGAGELCINSIDADGMKTGYDIPLTKLIAESVNIPVIASGGAGKPEHLYEALTTGKADAALVASIVHYGDYTITELKDYLHKRGVQVRL